MAAGVADNYFKRISIPVLLLVVLSQLMGTFTEWLIIGNFNAVIQVFRRVIPGMSLQVFGGFLFIKYLIRK